MKILAHRGFVNDTPYQNSLNAFIACLECTNGFETDAIISKDGTVYLLHSFSVSKTGVIYNAHHHLDKKSALALGDKKISDLTDAEVDTLKLKDGSAIPKLSEVLPLFTKKSEKTLNIEIKDPDSTSAVIAQIKNAMANHVITDKQLIVSSFQHNTLHKVRLSLPKVRIGMLWSREGLSSTGTYQNDQLKRAAKQCLLFQKDIDLLKPEFMIISHHDATDIQLDKFKESAPYAQIIVWEYTEDNSKKRPILDFIEKHKNTPWLYAVVLDNPTT